MDLLFIMAVLFLTGCFINRKKLVVLLGRKNGKEETSAGLPASEAETTVYKILAYNAKDYSTTKDMEDAMELRLDKVLTGLAKQGHQADVELHATGFVVVFLIKYSY